MNELPDTLKARKLGAYINNDFYGCPMQADDFALLALTKSDLDKMMTVSFEYSCKWRYTLNHAKSAVIVFGESNNTRKRRANSRKWKLGNDTLTEQTVQRHVGILLSSTMKKTDRIILACQKLRTIIGSAMKPSITSPLTLLNLFHTVCMPRGLFGCELMNNLTLTEVNVLETTYRFCLKYMMCLPKRTKTNICLASLGVKSIEYYIDRCKLYFLLRLGSTPIDSSVKKLFLHRLMAFKNSVTTLNVGFISDVTRILNKYKLNNFIENFISKSYFPPKTIWKHM